MVHQHKCHMEVSTNALCYERYRRQQYRRHLLEAKFHKEKLPSQKMYVIDNNLFLFVLFLYGNDSRLFRVVLILSFSLLQSSWKNSVCVAE